MARKRDDQVHAGLERLKWEANHTYKEMAAAIGKSTAALYKVSRGERNLTDEWVRNISHVYSRLLKRNVTEAEVRGESTRGYVEFQNLSEFPPDESGPIIDIHYEYITKLDTNDVVGLVPKGSFAYLVINPTMKHNGIYIIEVDGEVRCVRYKSKGQPCFETVPANWLDAQKWLLNKVEYRVLYKVLAFYNILQE